jgi:hypothetical protein
MPLLLMVMSASFIWALVALVVLEALVIIRNLRAKEKDKFFWFCELSPILVIIGLLWGNMQYIKGVISAGLLVQFFTVISLILSLFFKTKIDNFKWIKKKGIFYIVVSFLLHLFSINLALAITIHNKATPVSLIYSASVYAFLFTITYIFTDVKRNINFIDSLDFISFRPKYYKQMWLILVFILLILPGYFIQNWIVSLFS